MVVTHLAPSFCPPQTKGDFEHFCANDENLAEDVRREREGLNKIHEWLSEYGHPLRYWYYGHYHQSATYKHEDTMFNLLNIKELKERPNDYYGEQ